MALTHSNIDWYYQVYYDMEIIDIYGSFSSVPLLCTKGGTNYNFVLADC